MRCFAKTNGFARISFRPLGLNLLVENESMGRKRILPQKNFNLGEVTHLPPRIVATGGKAAPCGDLP